MFDKKIYKMYKKVLLPLGITCFMSPGILSGQPKISEKKPNLLIIHTDEHNFRTLGCYRETLSDEQALMWGAKTIVETPNIDKIAHEGVLCTSWYASSPVCTPSRASMISGMYPVATGSFSNDLPMKDDVLSFAQILSDNGYSTSYVGKWHLDGDAKPGFAPERKFGFEDNRYMFNRGHWKALAEDEDGLRVDQEINKQGNAVFDVNNVNEKSFTTDFLVDRTLEILERDKDKPFCLMLSIPDPHGPNQVRAPYDTMYLNMKFEDPRTMHPDEKTSPGWLNLEGARNWADVLDQSSMAQYFGMVKCIDDNVGRILNYLQAEGLNRNTIVIFTSDHGDLMGEHGKYNKGLPYETSARVAFVLRYPSQVKPGKTVRKAFTTTDFTPTILGMMGIDHSSYTFDGMDASSDFLSPESEVNDDRIVYITNSGSQWVAAVNNHYKLVMSPSDKPWLFDLVKDPDEIMNFYNDPSYASIADKFTKELFRQMKLYNEPLLKKGTIIK
jgi:arylsulfatase A-like enzyme